MFVGHLGAGLALRCYEPRLNAGVLVFASLFSDVLLWILILAGVEHVHVPADFATLRYQTFTFPWSHSLVSSVVWTSLGFGLTWVVRRDLRCASFVAMAVLSHFILDVIEHPAELPILGENSPKVGLGLWNHLGSALLTEFALAMGGLSLYLVGAQDRSDGRRIGMAVVMVAMTALAIGGQWFAKQAPSATFGAISSLITIGVIAGIVYLLDREVKPPASAGSRP